MSSFDWLWVADVLCAIGLLSTLGALTVHWRATGKGAARSSASRLFTGINVAVLASVVATMGASVWRRYIETNHFPSQNMNEVLVMFTTALCLSMFVLHFALGLSRRGSGWAMLDDALMLLVFIGLPCIHLYVRSLNTLQRDLPPALQSYWFPPHLSALIFSYATLSIAGLICIVYFCVRFWGGVFIGGRTRASQIAVLAGLTLVPFVQVVTIPVLLIVGGVFLWLKHGGRMPRVETMLGLEKQLDDVSFRAFMVGIPFLTAGLWMGAFWAQEAWANYWGWDSKENSALITWLIYVTYIHLRMLGGYRGEKAMAVLGAGALSVFMTFQLFGYLPDSQKSMHRYTDDGVVPKEGMQGPAASDDSASAAGSSSAAEMQTK